MLENVQQATIQPIIETLIKKGTLINTDEYNIYGRLSEWGYEHKSVCHDTGEYARDEDGDGFCEVHVNTMEGGIIAELVASSSWRVAGAIAG